MTIKYGAHCIKLGKDIQLPKIKMNTTKRNSMRRVQELQHDLGLETSSFPNIEMSDTTFYANSHRRIMIITIVTRTIKNKK
jgi:hypothetical protein